MRKINKKAPKEQKTEIVTIHDMTTEGNGVGKLSDGRTVFVPRCAVGDVAETLVIKEKKSFAIGRAMAFEKLSEHRIESDCLYFKQCGGCTLRHINYAHELEIKRKFVKDCMERIGGLEAEVAATATAAEQRYRNKAQYPLCEIDGKTAFGFFASFSHRVVPHDDCLIQPLIFTKVTQTLCQILDKRGIIPYNEEKHIGTARHIVLRANTVGEVMCTLVINSKKLHEAKEIAAELMELHPEVASFCLSNNTENTNVIMGKNASVVLGKDRLTDNLCGKVFELSALSFYQVNHAAAEMLYMKAKELAQLQKGEVLLDLYCGVGTIGLSVCGDDNKLCGVEVVGDAVRDARRNAEINGRSVDSTAFFEGDAGEGIKFCKKQFGNPDVIIVDPPRKGLDTKVIEEIINSSAKRVVYISCNPATLARDLKQFAAAGLTPRTVYPFNLFPRTEHVETVVLMSRVEK